MTPRQKIALAVTVAVLAWAPAMAAAGETAAIATLAPVLALTIQQILQAIRSRTVCTHDTDPAATFDAGPAETATAPGGTRLDAAEDEEGDAP
ncbi:hypothetical protein [Streptomyces sp. NPDC019224]|uniref:hypothetical protein n=1 Tax=Streptomyces sp. NPDC019224 TaxID=3154484 RepID=UPI0033DAC9D0